MCCRFWCDYNKQKYGVQKKSLISLFYQLYYFSDFLWYKLNVTKQPESQWMALALETLVNYTIYRDIVHVGGKKSYLCFEKAQHLKCLRDKWRKHLLNNNKKKNLLWKKQHTFTDDQNWTTNQPWSGNYVIDPVPLRKQHFPRVLCLDDAD